MAISKELEAQILRHHFVEHWGPNTIASQLGVHHSTVERVLSQAGLPKAERDPRPSIIDPYVPFITETLAQAEKMSMQYREAERNKQLASKTKVTLDNFADQLAAGGVKELRVVLKADVQGSIEVLRKSLSEIGSSEVVVKVLHHAVGGINESDVLLADASDAVIIGFHVVASSRARELAEHRGVDIRLYRVIYDLIEDLTKSLEGMLEPETKEQLLGAAEVRQLFKVSKVGLVAGCLVIEGMIQRTAKMRVVRDDVVVADDRKIESLRRVKEDAREVRTGTECGIKLAGFDDLKVGDKLVCYSTLSVSRKLQRSDGD